MPAAKLSYVRWFLRDWFLSKARIKLAPESRMAYCEILWLMYESEDGYVDNDRDYLARFIGCSDEALDAAIALLNPHKSERFSHAKVQQILRSMREDRERKSAAGKARWGKKIDKPCKASIAKHSQRRDSRRLAKETSSDPLRGQKEVSRTSNSSAETEGNCSARSLRDRPNRLLSSIITALNIPIALNS